MKKTQLFLFLFMSFEFVSFSQTNFTPHYIDAGTTYSPYALHSADLDNDGDLDVVVSHDPNKLGWLENLGGGSFALLKPLATGFNGIIDIATGDFDNDGDLDITAASLYSNKIIRIENLGNGLFSSPFIVDTFLNGAYSVTCSDFDNDGFIDIIATGNVLDRIVIYRNLGNAVFTPRQTIYDINAAAWIEKADIDVDGDMDLVVQNNSSYEVYFLLNNGDASFEYMGSVTLSGLQTQAFCLFDADGDGDPELAIANSSSIRLYDNDNGDFYFNDYYPMETGNSVTYMEPGDIDGNGKMDMVISCISPGYVDLGWYKNLTTGIGTFNFQELIIQSTDEGIAQVNVGDYNGDGKADIVNAGVDVGRVNYLQQQTSGNTFEARISLSSNLMDIQGEFTVADLDNDGRKDIITTNYPSSGTNINEETRLSWYKQLANGEFTTQKIIALDEVMSYPSDVKAGDIDNDGDMDIVANSNSTSQFYLFKNNGNGTFQAPTLIGFNFDDIGDFQLGDLDNDGDLDVAFTAYAFAENTIHWFKNLGGGNFQSAITIESNGASIGYAAQIQLGHLNSDNRLDIIVTAEQFNKVIWYRNLGNSNFASAANINTTVQDPSLPAVVDLDNDGDNDLVYVARFDNNIVWSRNNGNNTFSAPLEIANGLSFPGGLNAGDLDGDGDIDLQIVHNSEIATYFNNGNTTFTPRTSVLPAFQGSSAQILKDLDNDSDLDIVFNQYYDGILGWLENTGAGSCSSSITQVNDTICAGEYITLNGINYSMEGTYIDTLLSANYCDSTVILNLRIGNAGCTPLSCNELFISEYIEGSSFNKAIEIYNPTTYTFDLTSYQLMVFSNGSPTPTNQVDLSGSLAAGETLLLVNPSADPSLLSMADIQNTAINFNGDDAVVLYKNGLALDIIGQIGVDPGTAWTTGGISMLNQTLVRKTSDTFPNSINAAYVLGNHFESYPIDDFTHLGAHTSECSSTLCNSYNNIAVSACPGSSYTIANETFNSPGIYEITLTNDANCDSIILPNLSMPQEVQFLEATSCGSDPYYFGEEWLTQSGQYVTTIENSLGCETYLSLDLTILPTPTTTIEETICAGESIVVNGHIYSSSVSNAIEIIPLPGEGCDSIVVINLTVLNPVVGSDIRSSCGPFTWINGITYSTSNNTASYVLPNASSAGCDSTVYLHLTILQPSAGIHEVEACAPFTWINGQSYTTNNTTATYVIPGGNAVGCDSTVTLHLTILPAAHGFDIQTACGNFTWINGVNYTSNNNTAIYTLDNAAANGCDSIVHLQLTILNLAESNDVIASCDPITWINGMTYNTSNNTAIYTIEGGGNNGCDSIIHLQFTRLQPIHHYETVESCAPYNWVDGILYDQNTTNAIYIIEGGASNGCDSIMHLNFALLEAISGVDEIQSCEPITWIDGITYDSDNNTSTFLLEGAAEGGCDSLVHLNFDLITINTNINVSNNILSSLQNGASYQWINCLTNEDILGATGQSYMASSNGSYAVLITMNGCSEQSECQNITSINLIEIDGKPTAVYPNPTRDHIQITEIPTSIVAVHLINQQGQIAMSSKVNGPSLVLDLTALASGAYTIQFIGDEIDCLRIIKE